MNALELAAKISKILSDKKCTDIITVDVKGRTDVTDYYVICSTKNASQAKGAYDELTSKLEEQGVFAAHKDGERESRWIVVDYGNVIVHIFHTDVRELYNFEKLWVSADGSNVARYED